MSQFSSFKDYIFKNLFPFYYQENDSYKDKDGKGILERFIEVCAEYFDNQIMPDIDNIMDILDIDKTPNIFLNYIWQYFDYIPYAYGVLVNNEPYNKENLNKWMNNPEGFPKADTRAILKYAVSLFKIRGTYSFYKILGRFYGVEFELEEISNPYADSDSPSTLSLRSVVPTPSTGDEVIVDPKDIPEPLVISTINNGSSWYDRRKAGYNMRNCLDCVYFKFTINIPEGMWEEINKQAEEDPDRWNDVLKAFNELVKKYLPVYARLYNEDTGEESVILKSTAATLEISSPPWDYSQDSSIDTIQMPEEGTTGN